MQKQQIPKKQIASEEKTRGTLLMIARQLGCHGELRQIFNKYDGLLRGCTNDAENKHIKVLAISEINKLMETYYDLHFNTLNKKPIIKGSDEE